jgi:hypothetical protein
LFGLLHKSSCNIHHNRNLKRYLHPCDTLLTEQQKRQELFTLLEKWSKGEDLLKEEQNKKKIVSKLQS